MMMMMMMAMTMTTMVTMATINAMNATITMTTTMVLMKLMAMILMNSCELLQQRCLPRCSKHSRTPGRRMAGSQRRAKGMRPRRSSGQRTAVCDTCASEPEGGHVEDGNGE